MPEWERVRLGEVVRSAKRGEVPEVGRAYRQVGVRLWGVGAYERESIDGADTKYALFFRVEEGDLIVNKIWARNGSVAVIGANLVGCYCSNEFPVFKSLPDQVIPEWLALLTKWSDFWRQCAERSKGTSGQNRIKPEEFLKLEIPLPPLPEQRRIVDRVKGLLAKVEEIRGLREEMQAAQRELLQAMAYRSDLSDADKLRAGWRHMSLAEVLRPDAQREVVRVDGSYPNFGIYSFGCGLFVKPNISGLDTSAQALYKVRAGQFIYSRLFAFEGSYGVVGPEFDGYYVSNEYPTFEINADMANMEFLSAYFSRPRLWPALAMGSKGLGDRRQRIQPEQILRHELLVPPLQLQHELKTVYRAVEAMAATSTVNGEHANALPSAILAQAFSGAL